MSLTTNEVEKTCENCRHDATCNRIISCRKPEYRNWQPADLPAVPNLALARVRAEVITLIEHHEGLKRIDANRDFGNRELLIQDNAKCDVLKSVLNLIDREARK